eukprot:Tbor_TRINITY_DN2130_c0_g1::TRINITY_DN2130_c0_g1_i2::g.5503::m.5503
MLRGTPTLRKLRSIPFIGAELSQTIYRTTDKVQRNPIKTCAAVVATGFCCVVYDAVFVHNNRVVSPLVSNHLEYDTYTTKDEKERKRLLFGSDTKEVDNSVANTEATSSKLPFSFEPFQDPHAIVNSALEREIAQTTDPFLRAEMQRIYNAEKKSHESIRNSCMLVTDMQLAAREPHWDLRNHERNWSILSRDQQKQKDSYTYRAERSRDDDFGRNIGI